MKTIIEKCHICTALRSHLYLLKWYFQLCLSNCCCFFIFVCFFAWPPVREVFPHYEVVELQPRTLTTPDLGSVAYFCVDYLLGPPHPLLFPFDVPAPQPPSSVLILHSIILPPGRHPYMSERTKKPFPAFPSPSASIERLVLSSQAPTTHAGFPLPLLPCCRWNIF